MCRSTVARVISVEDGVAIVEMDGDRRRQASTLPLPDVMPGEIVLIGLGAILGRVNQGDLAVLRALEVDMDGDPEPRAHEDPGTNSVVPVVPIVPIVPR